MNTMIPTWVDGTLIPVEKLEAHLKGLRHKAVSVFVICGEQILLQQRAATKYHTPGLWANTCCTHPLWEEDPKTCAERRLKEELGISGFEPVWADTIEYRADVGNGMVEHEVVDLFTIRCSTSPKMALNPEEVQAVQWLTLAELETNIAAEPDKFTPWLRIYLRDHKSVVFRN